MPYPSKLRKSLVEHNIDESIINQIFRGYEDLQDKSPKKEKITFFTEAMNKIDELMDYDTKYQIIDWCACCKSGKRAKDVKKLTKEFEGESLKKKLKALWEVPNMGQPVVNENGYIKTGIYYKDDNKYKCACTCFHNEKITEPISSTYCLCCAGHFRHHYQNALGVKLKTVEVVSSPISSLGKDPCVFTYEILD